MLELRWEQGMPKKAAELNALAIQRLSKPGLHAVGGVSGLHIMVKATSAKSWVLRVMIGAKRRDMGLGGYPDVTLAQARERARECRALIANGIDPIAQRTALKSEMLAKQWASISFEDAAIHFVKSRSLEWVNPKHTAQWISTLATYAYPVIGKLNVRDIEMVHISKILSAIWTTKTETATRVRGRIESVLDWATVHGYRNGENPARWKGHLDMVFAKPTKIAKVEHHPALKIDELPAFFKELKEQKGYGARALELTILTASRTGEVLGAKWSEFDLESNFPCWTIPAKRMKAKREHRVPLASAAINLLQSLKEGQQARRCFLTAYQ